jgi:uncharacterized protein YndB with AHSA1/START domain
MNTDRIEKTVLLHATRERVWRALTDSREFGSWFGVRFEEPFTPGAKLHGAISPTTVDAEVAKMQEPYKDKPFEITIEEITPESRFSFRWHPHAIDPGVDYSAEPTTLVVFELEDTADGILLTVTESGFDRIPIGRRATAFTANERGWGLQVQLIEKYLRHA